MQCSPSIANLAVALAAAQAVMRPALKEAVNPHFRSRYADLTAVWDACREPLSANGLSIAQLLSNTANASAVTINTVLMHKSGEWIASDLTLATKDPSPQSIGSAITYGRRFALAAIVGVCAEDDDDANTTRPKDTTHAAPPPRPEAPRPQAPAKAGTAAPAKEPTAPAAPLNDAQRWNVAVALLRKKLGGVSGDKLIAEITAKYQPEGATKVPDDKRPALIADLEKAAKGDPA